MLEITPIIPAPKLATVEDIYLQMAKIYGRVICFKRVKIDEGELSSSSIIGKLSRVEYDENISYESKELTVNRVLIFYLNEVRCAIKNESNVDGEITDVEVSVFQNDLMDWTILHRGGLMEDFLRNKEAILNQKVKTA